MGNEQDGMVADKQTVTEGSGRGHYLDPASPYMAGILPGGYIDGEGQLHRNFVVREMTGNEEDLLVGKGSPLARFNQIIANCMVSLGPIEDRAALRRAVMDLPEADRIAILITLRRASLGDMFEAKINCPNPDCKLESKHFVNLADLDIKPMMHPMDRHMTSTLTTGRVIAWHILTGTDGEWMAAQTKRSLEEDAVTLSYLARIDAIDGVALDRTMKGYKRAVALLKGMSFRERQELRALVDEYEGGIDTEVVFQCEHCKHEWTGDLPVVSFSFFFPSVRPKR